MRGNVIERRPVDGATSAERLSRVIGPYQLFALAFGCIIGSGWVVVLGDWLARAGPLGAVAGFVAGAGVMTCVALGYGELASRMPLAGGEIVYNNRIFGPRVAFLVGWFLTLFMVSMTAFEGTALGWIFAVLFPGFAGRPLYTILGTVVTNMDATLGVGGALLIGWFNYRGTSGTVAFQTIVTAAFLVLASGALLAGLRSAHASNLLPLFASDSGGRRWTGSLWIFATAAFWYNGFQAVPQAIEERSEKVSLQMASAVMVSAILVAALFYVAVVLIVASLTPWQSLASVDLATARAFDQIPFGRLLSNIVLAAAALSVLKVWNGAAFMAARVLLALARLGSIPTFISRLHPRYGTPSAAVVIVCLLNIAGIALGRGAILPIINTAAISVAIIFAITLAGLLSLRRSSPATAPFPTPGGTTTILVGLVGVGSMAAFAVLNPWLDHRQGLPIEWIFLVVWGTAGVVFWSATRSTHGRQRRPDTEQSDAALKEEEPS